MVQSHRYSASMASFWLALCATQLDISLLATAWYCTPTLTFSCKQVFADVASYCMYVDPDCRWVRSTPQPRALRTSPGWQHALSKSRGWWCSWVRACD
jgi:hypothetical protein